MTPCDRCDALTAQLAKARGALGRIEAYKVDWEWGKGENVGWLQGIARVAIASLNTPSPIAPADVNDIGARWRETGTARRLHASTLAGESAVSDSATTEGGQSAVPTPGIPPLTFEAFSEMNRRRCESYNGFGESLEPESKYTLAHWALSIASEAGEVCDAILGYEGLKERRAGKTREDIARELADVITYADLAIQKLGLMTADVLVAKFNEVNERAEFGDRFTLRTSRGIPTGLDPVTVEACARAAVAPNGHEGQFTCDHGECVTERAAAARIRALATAPAGGNDAT